MIRLTNGKDDINCMNNISKINDKYDNDAIKLLILMNAMIWIKFITFLTAMTLITGMTLMTWFKCDAKKYNLWHN